MVGPWEKKLAEQLGDMSVYNVSDSGSRSPSRASSTSSYMEALQRMRDKLDLLEHKGERLPLAKRPGHGRVGRNTEVIVNCFVMQLPSRTVHRYDVTIKRNNNGKKKTEPNGGGGDNGVGDVRQKQEKAGSKQYRRLNSRLSFDIIAELRDKNKDFFEGQEPAFDGAANAFLPEKLESERKDVDVKWDGDEFHVTFVYSGAVLMRDMQDIYDPKTSVTEAKEALQALQVIMNMGPCLTFTPVGRSFYYQPRDERSVPPLRGGLEVWKGFNAKVRLGEDQPLFNLNTTLTAFYKEGKVTDLLPDLLDKGRDPGRFWNTVASQPLDGRDVRKLKEIFRGMKVELMHFKKKRMLRVDDVTSAPATACRFMDEVSGKEMSVAAYFADHYKQLKYPNLPCVVRKTGVKGGGTRRQMWPLEVVYIPHGTHHKGRLTGYNTSQVIKSAAVQPQQRFGDIKKQLDLLMRDPNSAMQPFGVRIDPEPLRCKARILPHPELAGGGESLVSFHSPGVMNMQNNTVIQGGKLKSWIFVDTVGLDDEDIETFARKLHNQAKSLGLPGFPKPINPFHLDRFSNASQLIKPLKKMKEAEVHFVFVILPKDSPHHDEIKYITDVQVGILSKCVTDQTIDRCIRGRGGDAICVNIIYGLNPQIGGKNIACQMNKMPPFLTRPSLVIGADVNHPAPNKPNYPSIAAVVGCVEYSLNHFHPVVRVQRRERNTERELIRNIREMVAEIIDRFLSTNRKPERLIYFRDGISEGQFDQVILFEMAEIRAACIAAGFDPTITVVIVQKRHQVRLMPTERRGPKANVEPGTCVDRTIVHPHMFDFYLCSHEGIQGTSKPAHYTCIHDENNFTADTLQQLSHYLCHMYAKTPRVVSIPGPVYYAHWVAFRANIHAKAEITKYETESCASSGSEPDYYKVFEQAIKVNDVAKLNMYFL